MVPRWLLLDSLCLRWLTKRRSTRNGTGARHAYRRRIQLESLEERCLLSSVPGEATDAWLAERAAELTLQAPQTLPDARIVPTEARPVSLAAASSQAQGEGLLPAGAPPLGQRPYGATLEDTSEFMLGDVWVTVVLLESNGSSDPSSEDWTLFERNKVKLQVQQGLQWWEDTLTAHPGLPAIPKNTLDFQLDFTYVDGPVATGVEPITRSSTDDDQWIGDFLKQVGYNTGSHFDGVRAWDDAQRLAHNADWAFTIFIVDSSKDAVVDPTNTRGMFSDGMFAYAYVGGPYLVMTYTNDGWGSDNMHQVLAHEAGHIFYALDEYHNAGTYTDHSGYYNTQNLNALDGNPTPSSRVPSIMGEADLQTTAYATHTSSATSLQMLGWRDTDGDGIFDVLDVPLTLTQTSGSYDAATGAYRFTGTSSVQTLANQNPYPSGYKHAITLNQVNGLQYRLDGSAWTDGNTWAGSTQLTVSQSVPVGGGSHTLRFRTLDTRTGLTSNEVTANVLVPPRVAGLSPANNSTGAGVTTPLVLTMDESVLKGTGNIVIKRSGSDALVETIPVIGSQVTVAGAQVTIQPALPLTESTAYYVLLDSGTLIDAGGNCFAGLSAETDWTFTTGDFTAPTATIAALGDGQSYSASSWPGIISGTAADTGGAGVDVVRSSVRQDATGRYWGGSAFDQLDEYFLTASGTATWSVVFTHANFPDDGSYTVRAQATDHAANLQLTAAEAVFLYDTHSPAAPVVVGISPDHGTSGTDGITNTQTSSVFGTAEALSTVHVSLGDVLLGAATTDNRGVWGLAMPDALAAEGSYRLSAQATDAAGNTSLVSSVLLVTIDLTSPPAPAITGITPDRGTDGADGITNAQTLSIFGTAGVETTVQVFLDGAPLGTATTDDHGLWDLAETSVMPEGSYRVTARATDVAGNTSVVSDPLLVTIDLTAPVPPAIAGITPDSGPHDVDGITNTPVTSVFGTAESHSSVRVFLDSGPLGLVTAGADGVWSLAEIAVLAADGSYRYTAQATDAAGNTGLVSEGLVVTLDTVSPIVTVTPLMANLDRTLLTGTLSDAAPGSGIAAVVVVVDGQSWPASISDATWSVEVPRSLPDGTYDVRVSATDGAGNRGDTLTLAALVADLTAPAADMVYLPAGSWDPRVHQILVQFREAVNGVDLGSFELVCNGQPIDLGDTPLVAVSDTQYVLDVSRATAVSGLYTFTLKAGEASVRDAAGNAVAADASVTFPVRAGQNARNVNDVNNDGQVTPLDVLLVINDINNQSLDPHNDAAATLFADVNGDDLVTPSDVLLIIDYLNSDDLQGLAPQAAEGESDVAAAAPVVNHHPRMIPINCTTNPVVSRPSPRNEGQLLASDVVG